MPRKGPDTRTSRHNPGVPDLPGPPEHTITIPGQHSFVRPRASAPNPAPPPVSLDVRGKIAQTVYQLTFPHLTDGTVIPRKLLQRRRHVIPRDPRTHAQLLCRARFAAAVHAWQRLTNNEKAAYNARGNQKHDRIEGLNVWIRHFISITPLHPFQLEAQLRATQPSLPFSGPGP